MIWTIAKKEILDHFSSLKFRVIAGMCIVAVLLSNLILLQDFRQRMDDYTLNQPTEGQARATVKPSVLSVYAKGLERLIGRGYDIRPGTLVMYPAATILNFDFVSDRFPVPDIAYVVRVLMSFLAMLLAFDTFSGEKQKGTLRLLLSNSVSRAHVVIGKISGNLLITLAPFAFSFCLGLLLVSLYSDALTRSDQLARLGIFFLGSLLYICIFVALAVAISLRSHTAGGSLVGCFFAWAVLVFAIPNLSGSIARELSPLPSSRSLEDEKLLTYSMEGGYLEARGELNSDEIRARLNHLEADYRNLLDRYVQTSRLVSRLSPASSYVYFATTMMGTGFEDEHALKRAVLEYRDALLTSPSRINEIRFQYLPLSLGACLQLVALDGVIMFVFLCLFVAVAHLSALTYDVR